MEEESGALDASSSPSSHDVRGIDGWALFIPFLLSKIDPTQKDPTAGVWANFGSVRFTKELKGEKSNP